MQLNFRKIGAGLHLLILLFCFSANSVLAADWSIDCNEHECTSAAQEAFFESSGDLWYPGKEVVKTLLLKNSSQNVWDMGISGRRTTTANGLENVLRLLIYLTVTSDAVFSGTLAEFYAQNVVLLPAFAAGEEREYSFRISMDISIPNANDYQDLSTGFALTAGLVSLTALPTATPTATPIPTPTPSPTLVPTVSTSDNKNNASRGDANKEHICDRPKPNTPTNLFAVVGPENGTVTLFWHAPTTPPEYTYILLAYGRKQAAPEWGNPDIGRKTSYTISGLAAGTYYFWVRAGNGCMPGEFAGPARLTLGRGALGAKPKQPATGFAPEVLGESISSEKLLLPQINKIAANIRRKPSKHRSLPILFILLSFTVAAVIAKYSNHKI